MASKIQRIFKIFDEAEKHIAQQSVAYDSHRLGQMLANVYSPGPSFQYIFDFSTRQFEFVSDSLKAILGYDAREHTPQQFAEIMHPDDHDHFHNSEQIASYFLFQHIDKSEIPFYKVSYQFRLGDVDGKYKLFLHQAIALTVDDAGSISKVLANQSDISHITSVNNYKVSFIDIRGKQSYIGISDIRDLQSPSTEGVQISNREIEVIKLISEGFSSKEIATHLHISFDTVRTHRTNILQKTGLRSMPHVVSHCVRNGLI
jgi:DNA-binding CsgD family transcriptional regulator